MFYFVKSRSVGLHSLFIFPEVIGLYSVKEWHDN